MVQARFRNGDHVQFRLGVRSIQGVVKEDRGPIGVKGRHLYLVEFRPEPHSDSFSDVELPADQLQFVTSELAKG